MQKRIAIQGIEGSFHQIAAESYFGQDIEVVACQTFRELVKKVAQNEVDSGVMAIENSTAGSILSNYDLLQRFNLFINGEIYLNIRQHLIALPGTVLDDIKVVRSHPMALLQCATFLEKHPRWQLVESADTALSAKALKTQIKKDSAAIASARAAEIYGLELLQKDIHTEQHNLTRFLILQGQKAEEKPLISPKSSLYFQIENESGALARVLRCMEQHNINLSKLQSYPIPGLEWQYYFHTDMEFHSGAQFEKVMACLRPLTKKLRILGVYEKGATR